MSAKATKAQALPPSSPAELLASIEAFLRSCRRPVVVEPGETPIALRDGYFTLRPHGMGCVLEAWGEQGNLVRRIVAIRQRSDGRLDLRARTLGRGEITLSLLDRGRQRGRLERDAGYVRFREALRRILARDFPAWDVSRLTAAPDLMHSLSPLYSRAMLTRGQQAWAVIAASPELDRGACDGILTFGLLWFDLLRQREPKRVLRGLKIILPRGQIRTTANRLAFLNRAALRFELYELDRRGGLARIDPDDYGNLITELHPCLPVSQPEGQIASWLREVQIVAGVELIPRADGLLSLRVRGLAFAQVGRSVVLAGLDELRPVRLGRFHEVTALARELARFRSADAADRQNPLYRRYPERWLESQVRRNLSILDSRLRREPVYSQVSAVAGPDRGIIDLLASSRPGGLVVIELKAEEDIHLPLQGLDYWMRVKWHLECQEFAAKGYFGGRELSSVAPRLVLVSPAFDFHPTTEIILRYFSPEVDVERVGVSADWRRELKAVFRKRGAERLA